MKIIERIYNVETGETIDYERDETVAEKKIRETKEKELTKIKAEIETKAAARQAIADRLGLTADELAVLLG